MEKVRFSSYRRESFHACMTELIFLFGAFLDRRLEQGEQVLAAKSYFRPAQS